MTLPTSVRVNAKFKGPYKTRVIGERCILCLSPFEVGDEQWMMDLRDASFDDAYFVLTEEGHVARQIACGACSLLGVEDDQVAALRARTVKVDEARCESMNASNGRRCRAVAYVQYDVMTSRNLCPRHRSKPA